jgi:hypothetical protein
MSKGTEQHSVLARTILVLVCVITLVGIATFATHPLAHFNFGTGLVDK